jgi:hypothetical protein
VRLQLEAPAAGSLEVRTCPEISTATQRDADGQDTPIGKLGVVEGSMVAALAPAGVQVTACPELSTPTQAALLAHDVELRLFSPSICCELHALAAPVGLFEKNSSPPPTPTQLEVSGHETPANRLTHARCQADGPPDGSCELNTCPS